MSNNIFIRHAYTVIHMWSYTYFQKKVKVGNDQENAQSSLVK